MILNGVPIVTTSSVFHSPDKTSIAELKFHALQQNLAKRALNLLSPSKDDPAAAGALRVPVQAQPNAPIATSSSPPTLPMPPPGLIPESLVRDILGMIKKEYPWAEALLASKMSKDQFQLLMDKLPQLKNIITSRMPQVVVERSSVPAFPLAGYPLFPPPPQNPLSLGMGTPHFLMEMAEAAQAAAEKAEKERENETQAEKEMRKKRAMFTFIDLLLQIKRCTETGLLYEEILNEPLSPMTMSMVNSMVVHARKLTAIRRAVMEGRTINPDDEMVVRKRLMEMREYIREEQEIYIATLKRKPDGGAKEKQQTVEEMLRKFREREQ